MSQGFVLLIILVFIFIVKPPEYHENYPFFSLISHYSYLLYVIS